MPTEANRMHEPASKLFNKRTPVLDGFRGLAILLVIGYHYSGFFSFGWVGVDLFFVLSGFLITGKLLESAGQKSYFYSFYLKRSLRIIPLYFFVLLFFFVVVPVFFHSVVTASYKDLFKLQGYYWTFTVNIYESFHGWPDNIALVPLWSLACEMQFYLVWPFVVLLIYRHKKKYQLLAFAALIISAVLFRLYGNFFSYPFPIYRYVLLPSRVDAFACGAILAACIKNGWYTKFLQKGWVLSVVSLLLATAIMFNQHQLWYFGATLVGAYGYTLNALFWAGLIGFAWFVRNTILEKALSVHWLTAAGRYSYAMYIFHVPVKIVLIKLLMGSFLPGYLITVMAVVVTFGCSFLSYHAIEKRFLYFKDNLKNN
ncbi:MAG: acyltransferase [Bacteroidota bacterium]